MIGELINLKQYAIFINYQFIIKFNRHIWLFNMSLVNIFRMK